MRKEIIKMAKDSGLEIVGLGLDRKKFYFFVEQFFDMAQAAEREACAKVADEFDPEMKMSNYGQVIANRIRARKQA